MQRVALSILILILNWPAPAWSKLESGEISQLGTGIEIDRIEIKGVRGLPSEMIEGALEIAPGDTLERAKIVRTEEDLQALYRIHGYEQQSVRTRLIRKKNERRSLETVLEFDIHEGMPVRIANIQLVAEGSQIENLYGKGWKKREKKMMASLKLAVGDIFDQEKLSEGKRAIQELLFSDEYIGAQVNAVTTQTEPPLNSASASNLLKSTARWVNLEFRIDLGDRVSFGFRGNTSLTRAYLSNIVDEQRQLGLSKDYVSTIKTRIEEEYHSLGYSRVEVTAFTRELPGSAEKRVSYLIQEGPKVKIESVDFDGNSIFSSSELRERFFERASGLVQNDFYVEKDVQKAATLVIEWLKERGYLAAKLITINSISVSKPKPQLPDSAVRLLIYIYEGDQTLVQSVRVLGAQAMSVDEIKKLLRLKEETPLNLFAFEEGIDALKEAYRDQGYLGFKILNEGTDEFVQYSQDNRFADISVDLQEGLQSQVSHIEIEGNAKTSLHIIQKELTFEEGKILKGSQLVQSERQLKRLGIFSAVTIRPIDDPASPGSKIVRVSVQEADRGILTWGPGFRNDLGIRAFGQLAYTNLWGENHTASVAAIVNRRFYNFNFAEGQLQVAYVWPWFIIPGLVFRPSISIGQIQYINFAAAFLTVSGGWEKQLFTRPNLVANLMYTLERIIQFNAVDAGDNQQLKIATLTPRLSIDLRDNSLAPTSGLFSTTWFDLAVPLLGTQTDPLISYYRFQFRSDYYFPIWKREIVWNISFRTGYEQSLAKTLAPGATGTDPNQDAIPLIKQFALGGTSSLRGFDEQQMNATFLYPNTPIRGSLAYVNYRTQLDLPFAGSLRLALFLDAANFLMNNYSFLSELYYGAGFGLHYQTPVGPVSLDWGFKLNPSTGMNPYVIHFSVGVI